jgi:hypothetical protein
MSSFIFALHVLRWSLVSLLIAHVFVDFAEQALSVLISHYLTKLMIFSFQHENILLIGNNYIYDDLDLLLHNHHLVDIQNRFSKNKTINK